MNAAQAAGVRLAYVPGQAIAAEYWTEYADIDGILLSVFGRPASKWQYEVAKRLFDAAAATALMALFIPLLDCWLRLPFALSRPDQSSSAKSALAKTESYLPFTSSARCT